MYEMVGNGWYLGYMPLLCMQAALTQLESAVKSQAHWLSTAGDLSGAPEVAAAQAALTARYHLLAAHVCWELGGHHRSVQC
jgi:hypothetical protein